ncbi:MAG TPA: PP2C family serine/threonine-protein phosphatase [Bryobacteraceae bacterium]|nr:PP2C family serine/threonine-protein phosphatase [Bryobacteraceae bacterium]
MWQVLGRSVRGASHLRSGLPNQDAIGWRRNADCAGGVLLAVADGHGSAKCFRSDHGSRFAIDTAMELMAAPGGLDPEGLPQELVRRWRRSVAKHLAEKPIAASTLKQLERKLGKDARRAVENDPALAYGSTLVAAMVSDRAVWYLQLGDGDILTVSEDGKVGRPWERGEARIGDETASLATRDAAREVRMRVTSAWEALPALVLLATDGYANSFREDGGFLAVGADLLRMIHTQGIAPVDENLEGWLREASELGSGDDITVGLLWR